MNLVLAERIRAANDIVEVIKAQIPLERHGANWRGKCPFHKPSRGWRLKVNPHRQIFRCLTCGQHGDVIKFVQLRGNLDFDQAITFLNSNPVQTV